jgi:hypothetical protein
MKVSMRIRLEGPLLADAVEKGLEEPRVGDDGAAGSRSGAPLYEFSLDEMIPADHLLRRINVFVTAVLADLYDQLKTYSDIDRPSVDPELMIRMLLVGYCYGIRHERRLCQEMALHLAYRWFCLADGDDLPHLLLGEPFLVVDQFAFHLADEGYRSAKAEKAEPQEVADQLADPAAFTCRCHILPPRLA